MTALTDFAVVFLRQIDAGVGRATWRAGGRVPLLRKLIADGLVVEIAGELALTETGKMTLWSIDNAAERNRRLKNGARR